MKGNCPNCPVHMDPPLIAVNMTQVGQPAMFGYYCKWECAKNDMVPILEKFAGGMTPADYEVPEVEVKMPIYATGAVWTSTDPFHQKVVEHTSATSLLAANIATRLREEMKKRTKFAEIKTVSSTYNDFKSVIEFDGHLWLCPLMEWRLGGYRIFHLIAGPEKVLIRFQGSTDVYNLALDPVHFDLIEDFDRILTHTEVAIEKLFTGNNDRGFKKIGAFDAVFTDEPLIATIPAGTLHAAGTPMPATAANPEPNF